MYTAKLLDKNREELTGLQQELAGAEPIEEPFGGAA